jgi:DNA-binding SARP family transcriptional activator
LVEIRILGPLEVLDASDGHALGGPKQRAVLAILALHANEVVSTEMLVDGVWGSGASERAFNAVQVYVSRLRKIVNERRGGEPGSVLLQRRNPGYLLHVDADALDLALFLRLAQQGTRSLPASPELAAADLREALALWRGPALAEFAALPFAAPEITRLEELRLAALGARVHADLALGRHAELVGELEALVALHPLHEQMHEQLMLSLYRSGRQAAALEAFRRARSVLSDELGVDPGRPLQELEAAILAHDPQLDWVPTRAIEPGGMPVVDVAGSPPAAAVPGVVRPLPEIWNVPARNPHFTGRTGMLEELHARLDNQDATLVVQAMYGMGGVGKSQLVIEYAHRYGRQYGLAWWIDAEQPVLIPQQVDRLAQRLGLAASGVGTDSVERLKAHLAHRSDWLLVFDNAERVEDVAPFRPAKGGNILVTSRYPGWGALGGRLQVDVLDRAETISLLLERLPSTPLELADRLAAELGDLPLAVAQAAAYMEQTGMDPGEYLRQFIHRRAALLARGDVVDYQGRIDTAWELSLEKLQIINPRSLALLQVSAFLAPEPIPLALFAGHEFPATGEDDLDELGDAVGAAVSFSLVRRLPGGFQLHRLIQAAIRLRIPPADSERIAGEAARLLAAAHPGDPNDPAHWPDYATLAPHILALGAYGDHHPGVRRLMLDLMAYLAPNATSDSGRRVATDLLVRWRRELGDDHADTLRLATYLTLALFWLGRAAEAQELGEQTLPMARRVLGAGHADTLRLMVFLMLATAWIGDAEGAAELAHDSIARIQRSLPADHPDTLRLSAYVALAFSWAGDTAGRPLAEDLLRRSRSVLGPNHSTTLLAATDLSIGLLWEGDPATIHRLTADTYRRAVDNLGSDHLITLGSAAVFAQALVWTGAADRSLAIGREFSERIEGRLGPDHFITLMSSAALASAAAASSAATITGTVGRGPYERATTLLGPDHPITLIAATAVVTSTRDDDQASRDLLVDTVSRVDRVLGPQHPLAVSLQVRQDGQLDQPTAR